MRNYVTFSKLGHHGRLGNQLFQISAILAYAMEHRVCAELPKWVCNYSGAEYWRHFPSLKAGNGYTMPLVGAIVYNEPCYEYASIPKLESRFELLRKLMNEYFELARLLLRAFFELKVRLLLKGFELKGQLMNVNFELKKNLLERQFELFFYQPTP
jgi:hypothetical protein